MALENFIGTALIALCFLPLFLMTWFVVDSINDKVKDIQKKYK